MSDVERQQLVEVALAAQQHAYAPYSRFAVGAALRTSSGAVFSGCNVENASYGLTICAERAATTAAVATGEREFSLLVIATDGGSPPCGACRQFLSEFASDLPILLVDSTEKDPIDTIDETNLKDLLPRQFAL